MKKFKKIALIGLDGSGKSTNLNKMKNDKEYNEFQFIWVRWKPILLKPIYVLMNKKVISKKNIEHENNKEKINKEYTSKSSLKNKIFKNVIIRKIWMLCAIIDYFIQFYVKTIRCLIMRKNIIFDRCYIDLFIDQGINFGYSPEKILKEIDKNKWLFPKINKYIYIKVSPEVCYSRKDDIPNMDYLMKRYDIYELLGKNDNCITINGEESIEKVYENIKKIIL